MNTALFRAAATAITRPIARAKTWGLVCCQPYEDAQAGMSTPSDTILTATINFWVPSLLYLLIFGSVRVVGKG